MQSVQVSILGQEFRLKSDASEEDVRKIIAYVEDQVAAITASGRVIDSLQVAVLALFNVAAAYLQKTEGGSEGAITLDDERLTCLADRIDRALAGEAEE